MKMIGKEGSCKGCLWLDKEHLCPFVRCVHKNGWKADRRVKNEQKSSR